MAIYRDNGGFGDLGGGPYGDYDGLLDSVKKAAKKAKKAVKEAVKGPVGIVRAVVTPLTIGSVAIAKGVTYLGAKTGIDALEKADKIVTSELKKEAAIYGVHVAVGAVIGGGILAAGAAGVGAAGTAAVASTGTAGAATTGGSLLSAAGAAAAAKAKEIAAAKAKEALNTLTAGSTASPQALTTMPDPAALPPAPPSSPALPLGGAAAGFLAGGPVGMLLGAGVGFLLSKKR